MREIVEIILHCSATDEPNQNTLAAIQELHTSSQEVKFKWGEYSTRGKGFSWIGYHWLVDKNGNVYQGRSESRQGAHCLNRNKSSIGICVAGNEHFNEVQFASLRSLVKNIKQRHGLRGSCVRLHREFDHKKTCPNFTLDDCGLVGF